MRAITRTSLLSGVTRTRHLDITREQELRIQAGELVQDVAPHLSADDREFLISGITADEWEQMLGEEE